MADNEEHLNTTNAVQSRKEKTKTGFYYSFLTIVLLFCLIQIGFGAVLNISKMISYRAKISTLTKIRDAAEARNHDLKQNIKLFSSTSSLESIARNNLKMADEDEVLVLINKNQNVVTKNKKQKKKKYARNNRNNTSGI